MNEIVDKLEGYKLVYPTNNKNLKVNISDNMENHLLYTSSENYKFRNLTIFEVLFYFNEMFINKESQLALEALVKVKYDSNLNPDLTFISKDGKIIKDFKIKSIKITDSNGNKVKYIYIRLIKEIYFNKDLGAMIIIVNNNFCSYKEKKYLKKKKTKDKKKQKKEQKEKSLLNSIDELLN